MCLNVFCIAQCAVHSVLFAGLMETDNNLVLGDSVCTPVIGDYDGDGKTDPAVYAETNGLWAVLLSSADYSLAFVSDWGGVACLPVSADYDGDRRTDPAVFYNELGVWRAWLSGVGYLEVNVTGWGWSGVRPLPADYDADGKADPAVYDESTGEWRVWCSGNGYSPAVVRGWGGMGYCPATADYDGDNKADPAVFAKMTGDWLIWLSGAGYYCFATNMGLAASGEMAVAVPADYDGDGKADPAVYNELTGGWFIMLSRRSYYKLTVYQFGWPNYQAVPGDYDGYGYKVPALYHRSSGRWIVKRPLVQTGEFEAGKVYYVSPDGNDSNNGTRTAPWATPGYASRQLQAGDTLIILGGIYLLREYDNDDLVPPSGVSGAWVTIMGEPGNRPLLLGTGGLRAAIDISGKSYVRLDNLEIASLIDSPYTGGFGQGIEAGGSAAGGGDIAHVILNDIYIHHIDQGGAINCSGDIQEVQFLNLRLDHATMGCIGAPNSYGRGGWRNVAVSNCYLGYSGHFYNGAEHDDVPLYERPDGFGIEDSEGPVVIGYTVVEHNFGDGLDSKSADTTIHHCIVANNTCDGIKLWRGPGRIENCLIYGRGDGSFEATDWAPLVIGSERSGSVFDVLNVTIDDEIGNSYLAVIQYDNPLVPMELTIGNTIFSARGPRAPVYISGVVNARLFANLFYMPQSEVILVQGGTEYDRSQAADIGVGNLYGDPTFVATGFKTNGNYRVLSGSPALGYGQSSAAPATDIEDGVRGSVSTTIGAYEYAQ